MLRVRLKADGRLVEVLPDGSEGAVPLADGGHTTASGGGANARGGRFVDAAYARNVRGQTGLTQIAFAARIGVPVETVRNWEQGKRSPRGPARALLKVIEAGARSGVRGARRQGAIARRRRGLEFAADLQERDERSDRFRSSRPTARGCR